MAETTWAGSAANNIVLFDRETGERRLISRSRTGSGGGNERSSSPSITADGRFVIFASLAGDLVENDTNGVADVFVRDTVLGTTLLASLNKHGTGSGNGPSSRPLLGADGRTVMFHSFASDLINGDYNERRDVFLLRLGGADTDGDGLDDDWEVAYFNTLDRDGSGDFDSDGVSDQAEFLAGTSPTNETSILRVLTLSSVDGGGTTLLWSAVAGRSYRVEFKDSVDEASWQELPGLVTALGSTASAADAEATGLQRFYRVVLAP